MTARLWRAAGVLALPLVFFVGMAVAFAGIVLLAWVFGWLGLL